MSEPFEITVHTWPYQWLYEPLYWAFAALEGTGQWRFSFKVHVSDNAIREALEGDASGTAIALCEPPSDYRRFRLIPFLWRLPVWGFVPKSAVDGNFGNEPLLHPCKNVAALTKLLTSREYTLYLFPPGSTVRRLTDRFLDQIASHISDQNAKTRLANARAAPQDFVQFVELVRNQGSADDAIPLCFTYSPLHVLDLGCAGVCRIAGGAKVETAIVFRDHYLERAAPGVDQMVRLRDLLHTQVKQILATLYDVIEPYTEVLIHVKAYDNLLANNALSQTFCTGGDLARTNWCSSPDARARLLAVFIHYGCFFPFGIVAPALGPDLWSMMKSTIMNAQLEDGFIRELTMHTSWTQDWCDLSTNERWKLLTSLPALPQKAPDEVTSLAQWLLHLDSESSSQVETIVLNATGSILPLRNVVVNGVSESDTLCPHLADSRQIPVARKCGLTERRGPSDVPCKACMILQGEAVICWLVGRWLDNDRALADSCSVRTRFSHSNEMTEVDERFRASPFNPRLLQELAKAFLIQQKQFPRPNEQFLFAVKAISGEKYVKSELVVCFETNIDRRGIQGHSVGGTTSQKLSLLRKQHPEIVGLWFGLSDHGSWQWTEVRGTANHVANCRPTVVSEPESTSVFVLAAHLRVPGESER